MFCNIFYTQLSNWNLNSVLFKKYKWNYNCIEKKNRTMCYIQLKNLYLQLTVYPPTQSHNLTPALTMNYNSHLSWWGVVAKLTFLVESFPHRTSYTTAAGIVSFGNILHMETKFCLLSCWYCSYDFWKASCVMLT
jgi:hypothetical protein